MKGSGALRERQRRAIEAVAKRFSATLDAGTGAPDHLGDGRRRIALDVGFLTPRTARAKRLAKPRLLEALSAKRVEAAPSRLRRYRAEPAC